MADCPVAALHDFVRPMLGFVSRDSADQMQSLPPQFLKTCLKASLNQILDRTARRIEPRRMSVIRGSRLSEGLRMDTASRNGHSQEIFIVDDDPTIHDVLTTAFSCDGIRTVSFADGNSFLAAANTQNPACVLLDVNMPDRS